MPMIKGVKFACEPCMRGHRSSKCTHTDRILVKVRKPGRPLSTCPHTLSSPSPGTFVHVSPCHIAGKGATKKTGINPGCGGADCSCEVTSVAIPKVSSCACGPSLPAEKPDTLDIAPPSTPAAGTLDSLCTAQTSPTTPTSPGATVFTNGLANKVSKANQRVKRRSVVGVDESMTRRASITGQDVTLELLLEGGGECSKSTEAVKMAGCCGSGESSTCVTKIVKGNTSGKVQGNGTVSGSRPTDRAVSAIQRSQPSANGASTLIPNGRPDPKVGTGINGAISLDVWSPEDISTWGTPSPPPLRVPALKPGGSSHGGQADSHDNTSSPPRVASSCCGGGGQSGNFAKPQLQVPPPAPPPLASVGYFHPQAYSSYIPGQSFQPMPVWYPPGSSTINHPLTPQELVWLQQVRAGIFPTLSQTQQTLQVGLMDGSSWACNCACGAGCDCLGCVSHPYNRRTVNYIKELRQFAMNDHSYCSHPHPQSQANVFGQGPSSSEAPRETPRPVSAPPMPAPLCCCNGDPPGHMPGPGSSQLSPATEQEEAATSPDNGPHISPNAFLYVDYPMGSCSESDPSCECGEGCTCVGCLSHREYDGTEWTTSTINTGGTSPSTSTSAWWGELGNNTTGASEIERQMWGDGGREDISFQ